MSEQQFHQADMEVISMVNNRRAEAGQLPGKAIHYIPEQRAAVVLDLDKRIEKFRNALPILAFWAIVLAALVVGAAF